MIKPIVSLIVPVYNAVDTLVRCVESVINQTFKDWELLLVNDGSSDSSGDLCDAYAAADQRIKVIHKKNGGVSSARNYGLDNARGEYIAFIDSDDYLYLDFLEKMLKNTPADMIICGFENEISGSFCPRFNKIDLYQNNEGLKELFEVSYYLDTPWCKLYKSEIISKYQLRFDPNLKLSEDTLFCYECLSKIRTVVVVPEKLYHYDGVWGGATKYRITFEEQAYMSYKITSAIKKIDDVFQISINDRYRGFHPYKIKCLYSEFTDMDIYNLYRQYYKEISLDELLGDSNSPLCQGMLSVFDLSEKRAFRKSVDLLKAINKFTTTPVSRIKFCSKKIKYASYLMRTIGPWLTTVILVSISVIK